MPRGQSPYQGRYTVPIHDYSALERGGAAWGQAFQGVGQSIGTAIEKYGLNKKKREVLSERLEGEIAADPNLLFVLGGDSKEDQKKLENLFNGNSTLTEIEGMVGKVAGHHAGTKAVRERESHEAAMLKSKELTEYYKNRASEIAHQRELDAARLSDKAQWEAMQNKFPDHKLSGTKNAKGVWSWTVSDKSGKTADFTQATMEYNGKTIRLPWLQGPDNKTLLPLYDEEGNVHSLEELNLGGDELTPSERHTALKTAYETLGSTVMTSAMATAEDDPKKKLKVDITVEKFLAISRSGGTPTWFEGGWRRAIGTESDTYDYQFTDDDGTVYNLKTDSLSRLARSKDKGDKDSHKMVRRYIALEQGLTGYDKVLADEDGGTPKTWDNPKVRRGIDNLFFDKDE